MNQERIPQECMAIHREEMRYLWGDIIAYDKDFCKYLKGLLEGCVVGDTREVTPLLQSKHFILISLR